MREVESKICLISRGDMQKFLEEIFNDGRDRGGTCEIFKKLKNVKKSKNLLARLFPRLTKYGEIALWTSKSKFFRSSSCSKLNELLELEIFGSYDHK